MVGFGCVLKVDLTGSAVEEVSGITGLAWVTGKMAVPPPEEQGWRGKVRSVVGLG